MPKLYTHCVVCKEPLPNGRVFTCSRDCQTIWEVDKWRAQRRDEKRQETGIGPLRAKPLSFNSKLRGAQANSKGKHKRRCDYCNEEFLASQSKQYFCTPQCAILNGMRTPEYPQRRQPSMPKLPWEN